MKEFNIKLENITYTYIPIIEDWNNIITKLQLRIVNMSNSWLL